MKNFCLEHATKIINYEKKEMIPLTKGKKELMYSKKMLYMQKIITITMKIMTAIKHLRRLEIIVIILESIEVLLMIFAT